MIGWPGRCEVHDKFTVEDIVNVRKQFNCFIIKPYAEGAWTEGTGGSVESFTWDCVPLKWAGWMSDSRNIEMGVKQ